MNKLIKKEISKIIDVYNSRKIKFIIKYGIKKGVLTTLIICLLFSLLEYKAVDPYIEILNILIRLGISIIPGIVWGIVDYYMYKDIIEEKELFRINSLWYVVTYGIFGWGIICSVCNITFIPFNKISLISSLIALPFYGVILGIVSRKMFNKKVIKQIYLEYIKGKNITAVKVRDKKSKNKQ